MFLNYKSKLDRWWFFLEDTLGSASRQVWCLDVKAKHCIAILLLYVTCVLRYVNFDILVQSCKNLMKLWLQFVVVVDQSVTMYFVLSCLIIRPRCLAAGVRARNAYADVTACLCRKATAKYYLPTIFIPSAYTGLNSSTSSILLYRTHDQFGGLHSCFYA